MANLDTSIYLLTIAFVIMGLMFMVLAGMALHKIVKVYSMEGKLFFPKLLFIFTFVSCIHEGIY